MRVPLNFVLLTAAITGAAAAAGSARLPAELVARNWEEVSFGGKPGNTYRACGDGCIEVETDGTVSMIGMPVTVDLARQPTLTWEWRVEMPVPASDLTIKGMDDRPVALFVAFPYDSSHASLAERMIRPMVELLRGRDAPGRMISYVWGGYGEPGQIVESPFLGAINVMVIARNQRAPLGRWLREKVDVAADHARIFGDPPAQASHILIGADSDDTGARNRASVRAIAFAPR